ncbi:MAG TPA: SLC13 family permease [Planctomycetota bacterium]
MGPDGVFVIALTFGVLVLLVTRRAGLDAIGIGLLIALAASGILDYRHAVEGFGNKAVLTIAGLYVVGEGLTRTGAVEFLAGLMLRYSGGGERRMVLVSGLIAAIVSAFLNNTAVVVVFIPVLIGMAQRTGVPASRLLMPLSFAALLGGMCTLVGTSTNLIVSGAAEDAGQPGLTMFEMSPLGIPLMLICLVFMAFFAKRLVPVRHSLTTQMPSGGMREYVTEIVIGPTSSLIGKPYHDVFGDVGMNVLFFVRGEEMHWPPYFDELVVEGDVLMLRGGVADLADLQTTYGLKYVNDLHFDPRTMLFFELAIAPNSPDVGRRVEELNLWRDYGAVTVAVLRAGQHIRERASRLMLRAGDLLLVCGDEASQTKLRASSDFYLLTGAHKRIKLRGHARRAMGIALGVVALFAANSMFGLEQVPLPFAALGGAIAMVATGCVSPRRAYGSIDWAILVFIVGTLALGRAMENTHAAGFFAHGIIGVLADSGPAAVVSGLVLLCIVFNALIAHSAVAVLLTPIAIQAAAEYSSTAGFAPDGPQATAIMRAFILAIAFGGSICFATPIGHQVNLMVYGPGGYRYSDFLRLGLPLSLLAWIVVSIGLPLITGI